MRERSGFLWWCEIRGAGTCCLGWVLELTLALFLIALDIRPSFVGHAEHDLSFL
jgi:hypothetical protein